MDQPALGHKVPKPGYGRLSFCPACSDLHPTPVPLTSRHAYHLFCIISFYRHVLEDCPAVSIAREEEGITQFLSDCRKEGMSRVASYRSYLLGKDCKGVQVPFACHLERGGSLARLTDAWLSLWYENIVVEEEEDRD